MKYDLETELRRKLGEPAWAYLGEMSRPRYIYAWGNNEKRATLKGRECVILCTMRANSVIVRFTDNGQIECVSRRALRRLP